ncbi:MAG: AraC family transcriptional regulator, partial [Bacteroidetes bacterium]
MEIYRKYLSVDTLAPPTEAGPNWGVNIHTVGHYIHSPYAPYPDPKHPDSYRFSWEEGRRLHEYQIVYIAKGRGVYESEYGLPLRVEAGTILLQFPDVWHRYRPDTESGWEEFWVGFDGHYASYLMQQECFDPRHPPIRIGFNAEFLQAFTRLIETVKQEGVAHRQLSSCLVIQLLGLVYASALMAGQSQPRLRQEQIVRQIQYVIHEKWDQALDFEQLAREHHVSYVWFRKAFKDVIGTSPGQYHLGIRITEAARMLKEMPLSVSEIAYKAGFESEFYFSRIFKKKIGLAPGE